jgi:muramidase (phage lysozyme)
MKDTTPLLQAWASQNVRAFAHVVRAGETCHTEDAYRWLYGSTVRRPKLFESFADHPRLAFDTPWGWTSAAGAYQFMCAVPGKVKTNTWGELVAEYGFADFSPECQDLAFVALLVRRKALEDVMAGRLADAVRKCNREWASLPGSPYGQPTHTMASAFATFAKFGGLLDAPVPGAVAPAPVPVDSPTETPAPASEGAPITVTKEPTMGPFLPAAFSAIASVVPELVKLFGSGSDVAVRNAKAVETVVEAAKVAVGAANEQDLIERIETDPTAALQVKDAVAAVWWEITPDFSGIPEARKANLAAVEHGMQSLASPAFIISLLLLLLPFMLTVDMLFVHPDLYEDNLRTQIVTGLLFCITAVGAFWLGTSYGSQRKTELMTK